MSPTKMRAWPMKLVWVAEGGSVVAVVTVADENTARKLIGVTHPSAMYYSGKDGVVHAVESRGEKIIPVARIEPDES